MAIYSKEDSAPIFLWANKSRTDLTTAFHAVSGADYMIAASCPTYNNGKGTSINANILAEQYAETFEELGFADLDMHEAAQAYLSMTGLDINITPRVKTFFRQEKSEVPNLDLILVKNFCETEEESEIDQELDAPIHTQETTFEMV